jgi:anti-sigma regulatory factor (Ser/Thr protein kinase)
LNIGWSPDVTLASQQSRSDTRFRHRALFYKGIDELVAGAVPFIRDGLEAAEPVLVAVLPDKCAALREALGADAARVQFIDMAEAGRNPARIMAVWQQFLDDHSGKDGVSALRGLGEPIWAGRRPAEIVECQVHEVLLNVGFHEGPGWQLMCPYDIEALPAEVVAAARRSHPLLTQGSCHWASADFDVDANPVLLAPLPDPPDDAIAVSFRLDSVDRVRRHVRRHASEAGIGGERASDLELAAHELAISGVRYGDGYGTLRYWDDPQGCVVEVSDCGLVVDVLVGRLLATLGEDRGRALWLVNQLCDLVQIRSSARGTTVRVCIWR